MNEKHRFKNPNPTSNAKNVYPNPCTQNLLVNDFRYDYHIKGGKWNDDF